MIRSGVWFVALALVGLMLGWFGLQTFGPGASPVRPIELSAPEANIYGRPDSKGARGRLALGVRGRGRARCTEEGVRMTFVGQRH